MHDLFTKIKASNQVFFTFCHLLDHSRETPPNFPVNRPIGHGYELPSYNYKLHKHSFVTA